MSTITFFHPKNNTSSYFRYQYVKCILGGMVCVITIFSIDVRYLLNTNNSKTLISLLKASLNTNVPSYSSQPCSSAVLCPNSDITPCAPWKKMCACLLGSYAWLPAAWIKISSSESSSSPSSVDSPVKSKKFGFSGCVSIIRDVRIPQLGDTSE